MATVVISVAWYKILSINLIIVDVAADVDVPFWTQRMV